MLRFDLNCHEIHPGFSHSRWFLRTKNEKHKAADVPLRVQHFSVQSGFIHGQAHLKAH